jgi:hypothetical protein
VLRLLAGAVSVEEVLQGDAVEVTGDVAFLAAVAPWLAERRVDSATSV